LSVTAVLKRSYDTQNGVADSEVFRADFSSFRNHFTSEIPSQSQWELDGPEQRLFFRLSDSAQ
jgi:hypothetical protein